MTSTSGSRLPRRRRTAHARSNAWWRHVAAVAMCVFALFPLVYALSASLSALRLLTKRLTAVVTVADDGGSSGRLRQELDVLPPGDLRMALSALCEYAAIVPFITLTTTTRRPGHPRRLRRPPLQLPWRVSEECRGFAATCPCRPAPCWTLTSIRGA